MLLGNLFYALGAFIADYNETHGKHHPTQPHPFQLQTNLIVSNPNWPPHARFHNGQTMSLSVCLAAASIYFTFRPSFPKNTISAKESAFVAAAIGSFYCFAGMTAILYPGTNWWDKEYPNNGEQKYIFSGILVMMWAGYVWEASRMDGMKSKVA